MNGFNVPTFRLRRAPAELLTTISPITRCSTYRSVASTTFLGDLVLASVFVVFLLRWESPVARPACQVPHPLDVRQRSRLFTEEGGETSPADPDQHLAVYSMVLVRGKKPPKKQKKNAVRPPFAPSRAVTRGRGHRRTRRGRVSYRHTHVCCSSADVAIS